MREEPLAANLFAGDETSVEGNLKPILVGGVVMVADEVGVELPPPQLTVE